MKKVVLIIGLVLIGALLFGCTGIKDCGSSTVEEGINQCFDDSYKNCQSATFTQTGQSAGGKTIFVVNGLEGENCSISSTIYVENQVVASAKCSVPKGVLAEGIVYNAMNTYCEIV
jgi:hypothetical protein